MWCREKDPFRPRHMSIWGTLLDPTKRKESRKSNLNAFFFLYASIFIHRKRAVVRLNISVFIKGTDKLGGIPLKWIQQSETSSCRHHSTLSNPTNKHSPVKSSQLSCLSVCRLVIQTAVYLQSIEKNTKIPAYVPLVQ